MLSRIVNIVEGSDKILEEMKVDLLTLSPTVTSHSISIKQLETQMSHISVSFEPEATSSFFPSDTMVNPKNEV